MQTLALWFLENKSKPFPLSKLEDLQQWVGDIDDTTASSQLKQQIKTLLKISISSQEGGACTESVLKLLSMLQRIVKGEFLCRGFATNWGGHRKG